MKLGEFFIELTVDAEKGELTIGNLIKSMGMLEIATVGEVAILFRLAQGFAAMVGNSIEMAKGLNLVSAETGINITALQKWGQVADEAGWKAENMASSAQSISKAIADLHLGKSSAITSLGSYISLADLNPSDPFEVIRRLKQSRDEGKLKGTPNAYLADIMESGGVDRGWMSILMESNAQIQRSMSHGAVMSDSQRKEYGEIAKGYSALEGRANQLRLDISHWAAPELLRDLKIAVDYIDRLDTFFQKHQEAASNVASFGWGIAKQVSGYNAGHFLIEHGIELGKGIMGLKASDFLNALNPITPEPFQGASHSAIAVSSVRKIELNFKGAITADGVKEAHKVVQAHDLETRDDLATQLKREFR